MKQLAIDIETYSSADLASCGVYRYTEAPDFAVILFAYAVDGGAVRCVDLAMGEKVPDDVVTALTDTTVTKTAYNATFERVCLSKWLGLPAPMSAEGWECTMVRAACLGFPMGLAACGDALGIEDGKMKEGAALIRYFSKPAPNGERRMPQRAPERWKLFKRYCIRDVEVEQAILSKVRRVEITDTERRLYIADQEINDRGVMADAKMIAKAIEFDNEIRERLIEEARQISGLENPNSTAQLKEYFTRQNILREPAETLSKDQLPKLMERAEFNPKALRMLQIRAALGKTSNKKYQAMAEAMCADGRIRGLMQFYGASRTGRWAGRLVQVQNLPQNHLDDIDRARRAVVDDDLDFFDLSYDNPMQTLSELIRTALIAPEGHTLHVCDFSAIEARVIAWLAEERWVIDVFRSGGDIYCSTASRMFGVEVSKHGPNAHLRQKGKVAVLALGYGGGVSALEAMGASRMGLDEAEELRIVKLWRTANPKIVGLWSTIEQAAKRAIQFGVSTTINRGIVVDRQWGALTITLPSGRLLCYPRASIGEEVGRWGTKQVIEYEGTNQVTRKWGKQRTYGGKLTENVVQAIARDILGEIILRAKDEGLPVVFHVHDEIIVEAPETRPLSDVVEIFDRPVSWCPDLPLKGAGYSTPYYIKD